MRPVSYTRATDPAAAVRAAAVAADAHVRAPVQFLGGGTTLIDLMKLDVMRPSQLVDITRLDGATLRGVTTSDAGLRIGALSTMAEVAENKAVKRDYPVVSESLWLAASQQLRNMARVGGNVLQRTRCAYFRDTAWACNKREPGSGCSALEGVNRWHAVLGTSDQCIASYPGDWATALIALDATVETLAPAGPRSLRFADLHRLPGTTPHIETTLVPGELITAFVIPAGRYTRRSHYLKVRDRESYEFALASAAVALDLDGDVVREVRIGLGGPVAKPWRATAVEEALKGRSLTEQSATAAAKLAFAGARPREHNAFRVPLGEATIVRALMHAKTMEVA